MRAASNVPRNMPLQCFKVQGEPFDGHHPLMASVPPTLATHLMVSPVWERAGAADTDMLLDPALAFAGTPWDEELEELDYRDEASGTIRRADAMAEGFWFSHLRLDLAVERIESLAAMPRAPPSMDDPSFYDGEGVYHAHRPVHLDDRSSPYNAALGAWYHQAILEQLRSTVIWVPPRLIDRSPPLLRPGHVQDDELTRRAANLLNEVVARLEPTHDAGE